MNIKTIPINQINPATYNPRADLKPDHPEYQKLKRSVEEFGLVDPLIINERTGNLIGGHQRFKVIQDLGYTEVEVVVVDLPIEKEKALNIALNKIQGHWDEEKLISILDELCELPEFDISCAGFDQSEISGLHDKYTDTKDGDDFDVDAEINNIDKPVTQKGDLIKIGSHRILCGDSSDIESLEKLFEGHKATLLNTKN